MSCGTSIKIFLSAPDACGFAKMKAAVGILLLVNDCSRFLTLAEPRLSRVVAEPRRLPMDAALDVASHAMAADEVARRLATSTTKGPDAAEGLELLRKYGPKRLLEGKKRGPFMRFLSQFNNVLVYVLLGCGLHQADAQPRSRR